MIAIRGATTVERDCPEQIRKNVKTLLDGLWECNFLNGKEIVCIIFSSTQDIRSYYPAKAAREAGYYSYPLFSVAEPEIENSLRLCIRVMILADSVSRPVPVYLERAAALRKDVSGIINIAIDGPAGSGKSTVSKILGKKLDILCLDTGAMYRACALKCLKEGISTDDSAAVSEMMKDIDLRVEYVGGRQVTLLDGKDVSEEIRAPQISMAASDVSAIGPVRERMVALQREIASGVSCILDGRDIGTAVLPNAKFKFYLTASPEVRAKRRYDEDIQKGFNVNYEALLEEIKTRDLQDKTRKISPLKIADDAILVDSSDMTIEEAVAFIENKIQEKI